MLHMALPLVVASGPSGPPAPTKTYAEFQGHITTLATSGVFDWSAGITALGGFKTTAAAGTGGMYGSSWLGYAYLKNSSGGSVLARLVQHGMASEAAFNALSGLDLFVRIANQSTQVLTATSRNGYTSLGATASNAAQMTELIYWDGVRPQRMQPSLGLGPTPYDW